mmetsp:Transcript_41234/g.70569  ORF Transcript_41234/g.70569 Transcript_41234/m.70569 type:complete len:100 (+) Transcript_41234:466-765(+)
MPHCPLEIRASHADNAMGAEYYDRKIRISVSNLDIPPSLPGVVKEGIKGLVDVAVAPKLDMDLEMIYESDGKLGMLQAVETAEEVCWFGLTMFTTTRGS